MVPGGKPPATRRATLPVVVATLRAQRERLLALSSSASPGGEERVHDARVALRRLAAAARLSRGVPEPGAGEALRGAARDLRKRLSGARTAEVCHARLLARETAREGGGGDGPRLADELFPGARTGTPIDAAALRDVARLASRRVLELRQAADGSASRTSTESRLARRVERRAFRAIERLALCLPPRPETLHHARILAKHARYALEVAEPLMSDTAPFLEALREFQESAGDAHDLQELRMAVEAASRERSDLSALREEIQAEARAAARRARKSGSTLLEVLSVRPPAWRRPGAHPASGARVRRRPGPDGNRGEPPPAVSPARRPGRREGPRG